MDLRKLAIFEAVCRLKSFTQASEELHVSQPSITMSVNKLEEYFGVQLINRHRGGLVLTPEGQFLFERSIHILSEMEKTEKEMRVLALKKTETLRIGYSPQMSSHLLALIPEFEKQNKDINLMKNESSTPSIVKQLKEGLLDIGIVVVTTEMYKSLEVNHLFKGEIFICMNKNHQLSKQRNVTLEDFEQQHLVSLSLNEPKNSYIFSVFRDAFKDHQIGINPLTSFLQLESYFKHIKNNNSVGLTYNDEWFRINQIDGEASELIELPFEPPCHYSVAIVSQKDTGLTKAAKAFLQYIRSNV